MGEKRWKYTSLILIGLVVGMIATAGFWHGAGLPSSSAQGYHNQEGFAEGYWKMINPDAEPFPWDERLRCATWVNRGDHDTTLLWCADREHQTKNDKGKDKDD